MHVFANQFLIHRTHDARRTTQTDRRFADRADARGFARQQAGAALADAWQQAAGEFLATRSRVGNLRGGFLEVVVNSSTLVQEIGFQKATLLEQLNQRLPDETIRDLRVPVGRLA